MFLCNSQEHGHQVQFWNNMEKQLDSSFQLGDIDHILFLQSPPLFSDLHMLWIKAALISILYQDGSNDVM